jgi:nucleoside-diphosphate-sugar epimerase
VWGNVRGIFPDQCDRHPKCHRRLPILPGALLVYTSSPSVVFDGSDMQGVDESVPYPARFHAPYPQTKAMAEQAVLPPQTMR